MRVLVIGSGPVGQVLISALREDCTVAMACRSHAQHEVRTAELRSGLSYRRSTTSSRAVELTTLGAAGPDWDAVICTAPVTSEGVQQFIQGLGTNTLVASVSQVPSEVELLKQMLGDQRWGLVVPGFLAYSADKMVRWWLPPGAPMFSIVGPSCDRLMALAVGGSAMARAESEGSVMLAAATVMPLVVVLQHEHFKLWRLLGSLRMACGASNRARAVVAASYGCSRPIPLFSVVTALFLGVFTWMVPFDLEKYCRDHFGSHTTQTLQMLEDWIGMGTALDLDTRSLAGMRELLVLDGAV